MTKNEVVEFWAVQIQTEVRGGHFLKGSFPPLSATFLYASSVSYINKVDLLYVDEQNGNTREEEGT